MDISNTSTAKLLYRNGHLFIMDGNKSFRVYTEIDPPPDSKRERVDNDVTIHTHSHSNKDVLDKITGGGKGTKVLTDNGRYKEIKNPVTDHNSLNGKDSKDSHPISSITGLVDELKKKSSTGHAHGFEDLKNIGNPVGFLYRSRDGKIMGKGFPAASKYESGGIKIWFDEKTATLHINTKS